MLLLAACSSGNSLTGSLSTVFPLDENSVQVVENTEAFQVTYDFAQGDQDTVVVQLTVSLAGETLAPGGSLDLSGQTPDGAQRTTVTHLAPNQAAVVLPAVQSGLLKLSEGGQAVGSTTVGTFNLSFVTDGSAAGGHTLSGSFSGPLQSAAFAPDAGFAGFASNDGG